MADQRPTVTSLDQRMGGVEQQLGGLADSVDRIQESIHALSEGTAEQSERLWSAVGSISGLEGISGGLANLVEVLAPLRPYAPPSTALPLEPGVGRALGRMRRALGGDRRELNFQRVVTRWDGPVPIIGQVDPRDCHTTDREG